MKTILPDTNVLIDFFAGDRSFGDELSSADRILVTPAIAAEYLSGLRDAPRDHIRRRVFESFLSAPVVEFVPHDRDTANRYASIHQYLRGTGTPIPSNDVWIAASALQHGAAILTRDRHFSSIPLLPILPA
ncbi:MAG: PIN domain-containing protein [Kiritimatiellae bacterium]|nr:PIN domain-containing protein [Kiritimatiellia bacterium]